MIAFNHSIRASTNISDVELKLVTFQNSLYTILGKIDDSITDNTKDIDILLNTQVPSLKSQIDTINTDIKTLQGSVSDMTSTEVNIKPLIDKINNSLKDIETMRTNISGMQQNISSNNKSLQDVQVTINGYSKDIQSRFNDIYNQIGNIQKIVDSLKNDGNDQLKDIAIKIDHVVAEQKTQYEYTDQQIMATRSYTKDMVNSSSSDIQKKLGSFHDELQDTNNRINVATEDIVNIGKDTKQLHSSLTSLQTSLDTCNSTITTVQNNFQNSVSSINNSLNSMQNAINIINNNSDQTIHFQNWSNLQNVKNVVSDIYYFPLSNRIAITNVNNDSFLCDLGLKLNLIGTRTSSWIPAIIKTPSYKEFALDSIDIPLSIISLDQKNLRLFHKKRFKPTEEAINYKFDNNIIDLKDKANNSNVVLRRPEEDLPAIILNNTTIYDKKVSIVIIGIGRKYEDQLSLGILPNGRIIYFSNKNKFQDIGVFYPINSSLVNYTCKIDTEYSFQTKDKKLVNKDEESKFVLDEDYLGPDMTCTVDMSEDKSIFEGITYNFKKYTVTIKFKELCVSSITITNNDNKTYSTIVVNN